MFMKAVFAIIEEPQLLKRFDNDWIEFTRKVPRWLPRLKSTDRI